MTSRPFELDDRWDSPLAEMIERAWWLVRSRGLVRGRGLDNSKLLTRVYRGSTYLIAENRHDGVFWITYLKSPCKGRRIYYMTADGGMGLCPSSSTPKEMGRVLGGMRQDMVLDDLAMI